MSSAFPLRPGDCLHEDESCFVLYKPSGMLVHRGWGRAEQTLVDFARPLTPGGLAHPIQRLDRGASGPVLFAKSPEAAKILAESAKDGACRKDYVALVRGEAPLALDIDYPICRREGGPKVESRTLVRRLAIAQTTPRHATLVVATPLTGRLHQIRRHLKHENFPLYGDGRYGRGDLNRAFAENYGLQRLALHAIRWRVVDPSSKQVSEGYVPLPPDLAAPLENMGFSLSALTESLEQILPQMSVLSFETV